MYGTPIEVCVLGAGGAAGNARAAVGSPGACARGGLLAATTADTAALLVGTTGAVALATRFFFADATCLRVGAAAGAVAAGASAWRDAGTGSSPVFSGEVFSGEVFSGAVLSDTVLWPNRPKSQTRPPQL